MNSESVSLQEAARLLEVHYMTAYRYVRTGRLDAHKVGSEWRVRRTDLDRFRQPDAPPSGRPLRRAEARRRLGERLVAGDEQGAWAVVDTALAGGVTPADVYLQLLAPALVTIGERWEAGELDVADEHQASAVALRMIGRLGPRFSRRGRKRGTVVLGAAPGDHHGLPTAILCDLLRGASFEVVDLGSDTPAVSFADAARRAERLVAVGLCATAPDNDDAVRSAVAALRGLTADGIEVPILLGGLAVRDADHARELGADVWSADASEALARFDELAVQARARWAADQRSAG